MTTDTKETKVRKKPGPKGPSRPPIPDVPEGQAPIIPSRHRRAFRRLRSAIRSKDLETCLWQIAFLGQEELERTGKVQLSGRDLINLFTALGKLPKPEGVDEDSALAEWLAPGEEIKDESTED